MENLVLSCRVLGRDIEKVLLTQIINEARKKGVSSLSGEYVSNGKNTLAKQFYECNGFKLVQKEGKRELWNLSIKNYQSFPKFIKITNKRGCDDESQINNIQSIES